MPPKSLRELYAEAYAVTLRLMQSYAAAYAQLTPLYAKAKIVKIDKIAMLMLI